MIDPWVIIGWLIVAVLSGIGAAILLKMIRVLFLAIRHYVRYWKTRNDNPAQGQYWETINSDRSYYVDRVTDDEHVVIKIGNVTFGKSSEDWKEFVRDRRLWRVPE